jgi:uncharacterized protein YecE (DUF72 family)
MMGDNGQDMGKLYVGCAIWAFDGWAGNFYPAGLPKEARLAAYAARLTAVEGNTTFYAIPPVTTAQKWAAETPDSFRLCPKFPKAITHTARLRDVKAQTATFIGTMRLLGPRLGPLMLQLPPSFGPTMLDALRAYLADLPPELKIAVEVRHDDWFTPKHGAALDDLLAKHNAARIVFDVRPAHNSTAPEAISAQERKPDVPVVAVATKPFVVVRYISSPVLPENDPYLDEWADHTATWLAEGRDVYFFAHCPVEEISPSIARDLYHRVAARADLPPLPWDAIDPAPEAEKVEKPAARSKKAAVAPVVTAEPAAEPAPEPEKPAPKPKARGRKKADKAENAESSAETIAPVTAIEPAMPIVAEAEAMTDPEPEAVPDTPDIPDAQPEPDRADLTQLSLF